LSGIGSKIESLDHLAFAPEKLARRDYEQLLELSASLLAGSPLGSTGNAPALRTVFFLFFMFT